MSEINPNHDENEDVEVNADDLKKVAGGSSAAGQRFYGAQSGQRFGDAADASRAADAADSALLWSSSGGDDGSDRFSGS